MTRELWSGGLNRPFNVCFFPSVFPAPRLMRRDAQFLKSFIQALLRHRGCLHGDHTPFALKTGAENR